MAVMTSLFYLLAGEVLFTYSLESTRIFLDLPIGYELFLNIAYPHDYAVDILLITVVGFLFFAYLADSRVNRLPVILFGLLVLLASIILYTTTIFTNEASKFKNPFEILKDDDESYILTRYSIILFFLYLVTSCVRNVLLLEQIILPTNYHHLRHYIFLLVFLRLFVIAVLHIVTTSSVRRENFVFSGAHSITSMLIVFLYTILLIWMFYSKTLYYERIRKGVWLQGLKTIMYAILPKAGTKSEWKIAAHKIQRRERARSALGRPLRANRSKSTDRISEYRKPHVYYLLFIPPDGNPDPSKKKEFRKENDNPMASKPTGENLDENEMKNKRRRKQKIEIEPVVGTSSDTKETKNYNDLKAKKQTARFAEEITLTTDISPKTLQKPKELKETHSSIDGRLASKGIHMGGTESAVNKSTIIPIRKGIRNPPLQQPEPNIATPPNVNIPSQSKLGSGKIEGEDRKRRFSTWFPSWVPGGKQRRAKESDIDPYAELKLHWIYRAKDKSTLSLMEETRRFFLFKFIFAVYFIFNISSYFVLLASTRQLELLRRTEYNFINELPLATYFYILMVMLLPYCEYVLKPTLKRHRIFYTDLQIICFSCFVLLLALITAVTIQKYLENHLQYIPSDVFAQIRLYNSLSEPITVLSQEFGTRMLRPFGYKLIKYIKGEGKFNITIRIKSQNESLDLFDSLELEASKTRSFVISEDGILQNSKNYDPTIYSSNRDDTTSSYYVITNLELNETVIFLTENVTNATLFYLMPTPGKRLTIYPGTYNFTMFQEDTEIYTLSLYKIEPGALYGFFVFEKDKYITLAVFTAEGPVRLHISIILIQLFLLCFALAIAAVSFFKFLFVESSPKLRCAAFANIYIFGMISVAVSSTYGVPSAYPIFSEVIMVVIVFHFVGMLFVIYSSTVYNYNHEYIKG